METRPNPNPASSVDVQRFLNEHRFSGYQWRIFAMCFFIMLLDGFDTAVIGYIAPSLLSEWGGSKAALAPVLSAALFGLAVGALLAGPLADRLGRKSILVVSVGIFGSASLASAFAGSLTELSQLRFVTGLGLGAAMPNVVTLMNEYCPEKRSSLLTNAMFSGFPLGAALGGFIASWMIPHHGWRSVLVLGGAAPLLLVAVLAILLPESVRHMVRKHYPAARIQDVLSRIAGHRVTATVFTLNETVAVNTQKTGLSLVLSRSFAFGSVMLWASYFMGLVIFYALVNWMPLLLKDAGVDPKSTVLIAALFPLGGVGAAFFGWLMDRSNGTRMVALCYLLTALCVFAIGQATQGGLGLLLCAIFIAGVLVCTAQASLPALAASFYPTAGRATGVAWMLGIGRFGGIAGSFLVAELTRLQFGMETIFAVLAIPAALASVALLLKHLFSRNATATVETSPKHVPAH